jgi:hypothetical protein
VARLTSHEKVRRDADVVTDRARGLAWTTIAARHELTERQCRNIWNERLREVSLEPVDVRFYLGESIAQLDAAIEELALLAETTANDPVRLGAVKARLDALGSKFELMRLSGLLPFDARAVRTEAQLREICAMVLELFDRYEVPRAAKVELRDSLEAALSSRNGSSVGD